AESAAGHRSAEGAVRGRIRSQALGGDGPGTAGVRDAAGRDCARHGEQTELPRVAVLAVRRAGAAHGAAGTSRDGPRPAGAGGDRSPRGGAVVVETLKAFLRARGSTRRRRGTLRVRWGTARA